MTGTFKIAAAAMNSAHNKSRNLEKMRAFVKQAAQQGVRFLVFPEGALQGYIFHARLHVDEKELDYFRESAESVPGPSTKLWADWAAEFDLYLVAGLWERTGSDLSNSAVLVGPQGYIGCYRKVHQTLEEMHHYQPGRSWPVFKTPLVNVGMMICYDQCFPEAARELTLRGAELLVVPNAWRIIDPISAQRYDFFGRARAAENNRWLVQSNQVGRSERGTLAYQGNSRVIDPGGAVLACTPDGQEGLAIAEIAPRNNDLSHGNPSRYHEHRVPSTYTTISKCRTNC
jgi:predicted amidohydrolase